MFCMLAKQVPIVKRIHLLLKAGTDNFRIGRWEGAAGSILRLCCRDFRCRYTLRIVVDVLTSVHIHSIAMTEQALFTGTIIHIQVWITKSMDKKHVACLALVATGLAGSLRGSKNESAHTPLNLNTAFCICTVRGRYARLSQGMHRLKI